MRPVSRGCIRVERASVRHYEWKPSLQCCFSKALEMMKPNQTKCNDVPLRLCDDVSDQRRLRLLQ